MLRPVAQIITSGIHGRSKELHLYYPLTERRDSDSDAEKCELGSQCELRSHGKREEIAGLDHKMLWFEGKIKCRLHN